MNQQWPEEDARGSQRLSLPAPYTLVRVRRAGESNYHWTGYIYDISKTGMRFELDAPVEPGARLEVRAMLPGSHTTTFRAAGTVVRIHDDDNLPGPTRMGMTFDQFDTDIDERNLNMYIGERALKAA